MSTSSPPFHASRSLTDAPSPPRRVCSLVLSTQNTAGGSAASGTASASATAAAQTTRASGGAKGQVGGTNSQSRPPVRVTHPAACIPTMWLTSCSDASLQIDHRRARALGVRARCPRRSGSCRTLDVVVVVVCLGASVGRPRFLGRLSCPAFLPLLLLRNSSLLSLTSASATSSRPSRPFFLAPSISFPFSIPPTLYAFIPVDGRSNICPFYQTETSRSHKDRLPQCLSSGDNSS